MHYFEYATKDTTLYESSASMNTGLDEILEIRKDMNEDASVVNVSRALIKFDLTYISQSVSSGLIPSGSSTRYYLNLYDANSTQLNISQTLYGYPVSQSWEMGSGRLDSAPRITDGASWRYRDNDEDETPWFGTYVSLQGNTFASGTLTINDGEYSNQEITIGGVDFVFVSGSTAVFDNNSAEIFVTSGSSATATATITITDFTELNTGDKVNLIATDTTNYDFTNGDQSSVAGTWESTTSNEQTATNLMNVINTSSGPAGTRFTATVDGAVVTATQAISGVDGNTTVTLTDSGTVGMSSTSFTGGVTGVNISANNLRNTINNTSSASLHGLPISASRGETGIVILSGSSAGTNSNLSAVSSSVLFTFDGTESKALEGGTDTTVTLSGGGGSWYSGSGYEASQSFTHEAADVRMDVSDIVGKWLDSTVPNDGFMVKRSGSIGNSSALVEEGNSTKFGHFSFFGRDTHTVYQPKLEVVWDDSKWITGSLSALSNTDIEDMVFYMKGLRPEYKETSKVKFRVVGRERFPEKTYVTSGYSTGYTTVKTLPSGSTYYQIKDAYTEDVIVPFGDGTKVSCDSTGNYFNLWMDGLQAERFYRINYKIVSGSGTAGETVQYFDEKHSFKVVR